MWGKERINHSLGKLIISSRIAVSVGLRTSPSPGSKA